MKRKQIYDTSTLLSIAIVGRLDLIRQLNVSVVIPPGVLRELESISHFDDPLGKASREALRFIRRRVRKLKREFQAFAQRTSQFPKIGEGEAEVVALAYQLKAQDIIIDDVTAIGGLAGIARVIGVEIIPSSFVFATAYSSGIISYEEAVAILDQLARERGWSHSIIYDSAKVINL